MVLSIFWTRKCWTIFILGSTRKDGENLEAKKYNINNLDLRTNLRTFAGTQQPYRAFPKLESAEQQR